MRTNHANFKEGAEIFTNYGSYNTLKYGFNSTKNIMNYFKLNLRLSRITSDGYRDNSQTEQYSYFAGLSKTGERSVVEINLYGGNELTHAAWYASREDDLKENHQHNPITYNNEIDDFTQPHYELHHQYMINEKLSTDNSLFYISGKGYYEQYKDERDLWEYGLADSPETIETDLIRQKHVEKNQFGWVGSMNWQHRLGTLSLGSFISLFDSDHWGEITDVIGADTLGIQFSKGQKYYKYTGEKQYYTFYLNEIFKPFEKISIMTNLHYQLINYKFRQLPAGNFTGEFLNSYTVDYSFFNPRFGINYNINDECNIFSNLSFAHREPTDDELFDIWDGPDDLGVAPLFAEADTIFVDGGIDHIEWSKPYVKEEKLMDLEFGFGYDAGNWKLKTNIFRMNFQDEIVGYGTVDEDGNPIRGNADETVHQGVELEAEAEIWQHFKLSGSFSYNDNFFRKFIMKTWDENWNVINVDYSGNKIAGFPDVLAAAKLSYQWRDLFISLQLQHVGKQYLDNTENDERIVEPFRLMNLGINYEIAEFFDLAQIDLNLKIRNLLDKEYETSGYYDDWEGANYYFPGAGRNIIAGIRARF
jgi:iron complex outermembrane receptor protein